VAISEESMIKLQSITQSLFDSFDWIMSNEILPTHER